MKTVELKEQIESAIKDYLRKNFDELEFKEKNNSLTVLNVESLTIWGLNVQFSVNCNVSVKKGDDTMTENYDMNITIKSVGNNDDISFSNPISVNKKSNL